MDSETFKQLQLDYQKQCVVDKMEWVFEQGGNGIRDFAEAIVIALGIEASDKLAEELIDIDDLRSEYEDQGETITGGYDRNGDPTITYTSRATGKRVTYTLN